MHLSLPMKKVSRFHLASGIVIGVLVALRIAILPLSPPGFFLDEAATGAHVVAMLQHGANAHGEAWPLFSASLGGGYTTPIYLYPLTVWAAVFGPSEISLRYFSEFTTLGAIVLLALGMRYWLGIRAALISAVVALALPWGWLQGSLAWDPALVPLFVAAGFASLSALLFSTSSKLRLLATVSLPVSLVALAYVYPPCRASAPLLFVVYYGLLYYKKALSIKTIAISTVSALIMALPHAFFILQPEALERSRALSVFYETSSIEAVGRIGTNFFGLLNPVFLFFYGDPNLRHAIGYQGMLGLAAIPATIALIYYVFHAKLAHFSPKKNDLHLLITLAGAGVVFGLIGSALTNEGQPHSLRASAAWPFMAILLTVGWYKIMTEYRKSIRYSAAIFFAVCTLIYAADFALYYPARAAESFDAHIRTRIYRGEAVPYPALSLKYYHAR